MNIISNFLPWIGLGIAVYCNVTGDMLGFYGNLILSQVWLISNQINAKR